MRFQRDARIGDAKALGIGRVVIAGNIQCRERSELAYVKIGADVEATAIAEAASGGQWFQEIPVVDDSRPSTELLAKRPRLSKCLHQLLPVQLPKTLEFVELLDSVFAEELRFALPGREILMREFVE